MHNTAQDLGRDLDASASVVWVTEAKYTGGELVRKQYDTEGEADKAFKTLTTRASTDWVNLYEVRIERTWIQKARVVRHGEKTFSFPEGS